jgi:ABC-type polysaccharide/polyol phosphate transport system ATPase subunit
LNSEPADPTPLLRAQGLRKRYARDNEATRRRGLRSIWHEVRGGAAVDDTLRHSEFWALDDVSLVVRPGEALGVMGLNGSGKSTLLRVLAGLSKPDAGTVQTSGRLATLLDPSGGLDPLLSGRENVMTSPVLWDLDPSDVAETAEHVAAFADIGDFLDAPVRTYSKGMRMRLAFATVANARADVILIDEALAVGDITFQRACVEFLRRFVSSGGALVIVSQSTWALQAMCDQGVLLQTGRVTAAGPIIEVTDAYAEVLLRHEETEDRLPLSNPVPLGPGPDTVRTVADGAASGKASTAARSVADGERLIESTNGRPVGVTRFQIDDGKGGPPTTGSPMRVTLGYRAEHEACSADWGLMLYSSDGQIAVAAALTPIRYRVTLRKGDGMLELTVPHLLLAPGRYTARTALIDGETQVVFGLHGVDTPATHFEVVGVAESVVIHGLPRINPVLSAGSNWTIETLDDDRP